MKKSSKARLLSAIEDAPESSQFALIIDAKMLGEPVDLSVEKSSGACRIGWRWDLQERSLGDLTEKLFPSMGELPGGIKDLQPGSIYAQCVTSESSKALSIGIANLNFVYVSSKEKDTKPSSQSSSPKIWGLVHEKPINLPTFGVVEMLVGSGLSLSDLRFGFVSGEFSDELRNEIVGQLAETRLLLGSEGSVPKGLVAGVTFGGIGPKPISVPFVSAGAVKKTVGQGNNPQKPAIGGAAAAVNSSDKSRKWFVVNKTIGPLRLGRVGCQWKDSKIGLLLDAAVDVGGLHFGLIGLSASLPPADPKPANLELGLDGVELSYRGGPISISGSFLKNEISYKGKSLIQYDGMAVIQAAKFTITGFGSYAAVEGQTSLFIFAILHMELGGPPCFRVNGLAAGFGYNRKLILPPIEEVSSFPLVRAALDANYFGSSSGSKNSSADKSIQGAMSKLSKYIPPSINDYWFAIGIRFNSFEMIEAFALLSVSFGNDVEIGLLGLAAVTIPKVPGSDAKTIPPLVYAELALRASIKPLEGTVQVEARLTNESYIFYKDCHLTGGFAFYIWFDGSLAGDFVLTLGGYHPKFLRPVHYPIVPRLGIYWEVTKEMTITAGMYFALTPSCLMVGGKLSAVYQSPSVNVWFIVYADFLLGWQPFYYAIDAGISLTIEVDMGASFLRIHLGAEVHIWGPEFAGIIIVDLHILLITVRFGPDKKPPPPLQIEEFKTAFLPKPKEVIAIQINSGLIQEAKLKEENALQEEGPKVEKVLRVVNAHALELSTQSLIPVSEFSELGSKIEEIDTGELGIRSMGKTTLNSRFSVTIKRITKEGKSLVVERQVRVSLLKSGVPDAIWGKSAEKDVVPLPDSPEAIAIKANTGIRISFDPVEPEGALPVMQLEKFKLERLNDKCIPWDENLRSAAIISAQEQNNNDIWTVMEPTATNNRNAVLSVLAKGSPFPLNEVKLDKLCAAGDKYFQADPEICRVGQALSRSTRLSE